MAIYENTVSPNLIWSTPTFGLGGNKACMQTDGNLVIYKGTTSLWASNTFGNPGAYARIQDDGNFVIYVGPPNKANAKWASGSLAACPVTVLP